MKTTVLTFTLLLSSCLLFAQDGVQMLRIAPGATELSRAETGIATAHGAVSIFSNPGLLSTDESSSISLSYTSWILDSNNLFGGVNFKNEKRALAFSFYTSGVNNLDQRDNPGESNGEFSIQYLSISAAYSYDFGPFSAGIAGHFINEEIYTNNANGYGFNAGIASSFLEERLRVGASILNLGTMEKLEARATELPSSFNVGASFEVFEFTHSKNPQLPILVSLMADYIMPLQESENSEDINPIENYFNFGASLLVAETIEVNAGYKTQESARPTSFGVGFLLEKVAFNYAIIPFNTGFGTVHSIGIQYQL